MPRRKYPGLSHIYTIMKGLLVWVFLVFASAQNSMVAQNPVKIVAVFKGLKKWNGNYQLWFRDKKNKSYYFNPKRSYTEPYVFFSTSVDGSFKENEKIKEEWFDIEFRVLWFQNKSENIITYVKLRTSN